MMKVQFIMTPGEVIISKIKALLEFVSINLQYVSTARMLWNA